jgi:hypothetical protein
VEALRQVRVYLKKEAAAQRQSGHQHSDDVAFCHAKAAEVVRRCDVLEKLAIGSEKM